jgi:hypothetical protein
MVKNGQKWSKMVKNGQKCKLIIVETVVELSIGYTSEEH